LSRVSGGAACPRRLYYTRHYTRPGSQHQPTGQDVDPAWLHGLGGHSRWAARPALLVLRSPAPRHRRSFEEVNDAVLMAGGPSAPLLCGLAAGPACGQASV